MPVCLGSAEEFNLCCWFTLGEDKDIQSIPLTQGEREEQKTDHESYGKGIQDVEKKITRIKVCGFTSRH